MDVEEIVLKIARLRRAFVFATCGGPMLSAHPGGADMMEAFGIPTKGTMEVASMRGEPYVVRLEEYFHPARQVQADGSVGVRDMRHNVELIRTWAKIMVLELGDWAKKNLPHDHDPLFEFVRHVRNAVAHGEHFDIRHTKYPAKFESTEITADMDGKSMWDYLAVGDLLALGDAVEAKLMSTTPAGV